MKEKALKTILVLIILLNLILIHYNFNYKRAIVKGESMQPTLYTGDRLNCRKRPKNIQIGDIIAYYVDGVAIMHRVVEKNNYNGITYYITKGDNNSMNDFMPIAKENIYCKVVE